MFEKDLFIRILQHLLARYYLWAAFPKKPISGESIEINLDLLIVGEKLKLREHEMVSRHVHSYIRLTQSIRSAIRGLEPSFVLREGVLTLNLQPDKVPDDLHTLNDKYIKESIRTAFEPYRQGTDLSIDNLTLYRENLVVSGMVTQC